MEKLTSVAMWELRERISGTRTLNQLSVKALQNLIHLTTLYYGPDKHITSTFIPAMPGRLFYLKELAGPLNVECNHDH